MYLGTLNAISVYMKKISAWTIFPTVRCKWNFFPTGDNGALKTDTCALFHRICSTEVLDFTRHCLTHCGRLEL